ncbi:MAG: hypothetical protein ACOYOK_09690 [Pseudobdellovibrionaceae bacterium]
MGPICTFADKICILFISLTLLLSCTNSKLQLENVYSSSGYIPAITNPPAESTNINSFSFKVNGTYVAYYKYKIGKSSDINCSSSDNYLGPFAAAESIAYDTSSLDDGEYKICLLGADLNKNFTSLELASQYIWTKDTAEPSVILWGQPIGISSTATPTIQITNLDAAQYKYAIIMSQLSPAVACQSASYSSYRTVGLSITDNISSLADRPIIVCVLGKDLAGNEQSLSNVNYVTWVKDGTNTEVFFGDATKSASEQSYQYRITEGSQTSINIPLSIWEAKNYDVTVYYELSGDAVNATNYTLSSGSVTFTANQQTKNLTVPLVNNATKNRDSRLRLALTKTDRSTVKIGAANFVWIDILDDEASPTLTVKNVAAGNGFTCAVLSNNKVKCWGRNELGQSASTDVTKNITIPPSTYIDSDKQYSSLAQGSVFTCGIAADTGDVGKVRCWGSNANNTLGRGDSTSTPDTDGAVLPATPYKKSASFIAGTKLFQQLYGGDNFMCGLGTDNKAYCWGENTYGQLGDSTTTTRSSATAVSGSDDFSMIAAGDEFACGILSSTKSIKCWGRNQYGQLGVGDTSNRSSPVSISSSDKYIWLAAGDAHACAINEDKKLFCWGYNQYGELGDGTTTATSTPKRIDNNVLASKVILYSKVFIGDQQTCGIVYNATDSTKNQTLRCWGYNRFGMLGDGTKNYSSSSLAIDSTTKYKYISGSSIHTCGITTGDELKCWGYNSYGEVGFGANVLPFSATSVYAEKVFSKVESSRSFRCDDAVVDLTLRPDCLYSAGTVYQPYSHNCALIDSGAPVTADRNNLICFGSNSKGQLGDGTTYNRSAGVAVISSNTFTKFTLGNQHTCAILNDGVDAGKVQCWGDNSKGQLGLNSTTNSTLPTTINDSSTYTEISAGLNHTCGITAGGVLKCWGDNTYGQLGDTSTTQRESPAVANSGTSYSKVAAGAYHTCGITAGGVLKCWGRNTYGQLGDASTSNSSSALIIDTGVSYQSITAGANHTCGITAGGTSKCWGRNNVGQLGVNSSTTQFTSPTTVNGGISFSEIKAGWSHTCGIDSALKIYCWGDNYLNQSGYSTGYSISITPIRIKDSSASNNTQSFSTLSAGSESSCAIETTTKKLFCWGSNINGAFAQSENTLRPQTVRRLGESN